MRVKQHNYVRYYVTSYVSENRFFLFRQVCNDSACYGFYDGQDDDDFDDFNCVCH